MDTIKKVYVLVDNETNEFVLTEPDYYGDQQLVYSFDKEYLEMRWCIYPDTRKYRIEEIAPLPF